MSLKDKLEVGLRPDAPYRKDNLPAFQQGDPSCEEAARPDDSVEAERARKDCEEHAQPARRRRSRRKTVAGSA